RHQTAIHQHVSAHRRQRRSHYRRPVCPVAREHRGGIRLLELTSRRCLSRPSRPRRPRRYGGGGAGNGIWQPPRALGRRGAVLTQPDHRSQRTVRRMATRRPRRRRGVRIGRRRTDHRPARPAAGRLRPTDGGRPQFGAHGRRRPGDR
ncbi:pyruvate phosphate dikinase, PEP/pyruvate binding domain protein, partial [Mycobacterium tuberculosis variant bovis]